MVAPWIQYLTNSVEQTGFSPTFSGERIYFALQCTYSKSLHSYLGSVYRQNKGKICKGRLSQHLARQVILECVIGALKFGVFVVV